jgi:hypothetical protein
VSSVFVRGLLTVTFGAAALITPASAVASPAEDEAFLAALDRQGITYPSPHSAILIASEVCTLLDDGATGVDVAREITTTSGIPVKSSGYFVGASITTYCPSHTDAFSG